MDAGDQAGRVDHRALEEVAYFSDRRANNLNFIDIVLAQTFGCCDAYSRDFDGFETHDIRCNCVNSDGIGASDEQVHLKRETDMRALAFHGDDTIDEGQVSLAHAVQVSEFLAQIDAVYALLLGIWMPLGMIPFQFFRPRVTVPAR